MSSDDISAKCRAGRHHRCMLSADDCLCECHDSGGSMTPTPQPKGDEFACPAGGCLRTFPTEQGARVHFSRTHGTNADLKRGGAVDDARAPLVTHSLGPSRIVDGDSEPFAVTSTVVSAGEITLTLVIPLPASETTRKCLFALIDGLTS